MKELLMIAALIISTAPMARAKSIVGDWQGALRPPGGELHLVLHITEGEGGSLKATLDSVDQMGQRHPRDLGYTQNQHRGRPHRDHG